MQKVLVVDDNPMDQRFAGACVQQCGMSAVYAADGIEALKAFDTEQPDIVLTDIDMPHMNGLELVHRLRGHAPSIPVILMTAKGSEEVAAEALKAGAASYVPKRNLQHELATALRIVSDLAQARVRRKDVYQHLVSNRLQFVIGNNDDAASSLVSHLQDALISMNICSESDLLAVGTALLEALSHAIECGNLELNVDSRQENDGANYAALRRQRMTEAPYKDRRVFVTSELTKTDAVFMIRNEGPGFDVSTVPDPDDAENLMHEQGRGLLLMQIFMDEVHFNEQGTEITMRLFADDAEAEIESAETALA